MNFIPTAIPEVVIIQPNIWQDARGYFFESYRHDLFCQQVADIHWVQDNESFSTQGTLRGLHYQLPPYAQSKLVRVVQGRVLDVAVDIRKSSPTFGQHVAVELSADNKRQLFIPRGFAHGYLVLSADAICQYRVDAFYHVQSERGIAFDDPAMSIVWPRAKDAMILSDKDRQQPLLAQAEVFE